MSIYRTSVAGVLLGLALVSAGCRSHPPPASASPSPSTAAVASPSAGASGASAAPAAAQAPQSQALTTNFKLEPASFPQAMGAHYVMQWTDNRPGMPPSIYTSDVKLVHSQGDLLMYQERLTMGDGKPGPGRTLYAIVKPDGIWYKESEPAETSAGVHSTDGASLAFKFPMTPGESWQFKGPRGVMCSRKVVGHETVTVPAGTYDAAILEEDRGAGKGKSWYVPGIGVVRSDISDPQLQSSKVLTVFEAKSK